MTNSLKIKSSIFLALLFITTVFLLGFLILTEIKQDQETRQIEFLREQSNIASIYVGQAIASDPDYREDDYNSRMAILKKRQTEIIAQLQVMTGMKVTLLISSIYTDEVIEAPTYDTSTPFANMEQYATKNKIAYQQIGDKLYFISPLGTKGDAIGFIYSLQESQRFYEKIQTLFMQIGAFVVILSFLLAYLYFNRITNGILQLQTATAKITQGTFPTITPLNRKDELGKLSSSIAVMSQQLQENIHAMEQEQTNLRLAVDKLKKLEKQQKTFINNITHEFKTPLSVVLAYTDLLDMYKDDPKLLEDARLNIKKEAQRLYDLVEKVLQLAALEKYDFEFQPEQLASDQLLQELCQRMNGKAQKFDVTIHADLQPATLFMDKESFYLIFINLIDNAIKYNCPNGEIWITSNVSEDKVTISIIDTGIGIPEKDIQKVFEPFYVVSKDRAKTSGGTGIGLALVKQLVEKQKGAIQLQQASKQGTEVRLTFPLYKQ